MRRKRDDDSSCFDGSSQTDSRASRGSSRGSSRKRRRTILDAFQSISLNNQNIDIEEMQSDQAPPDDSSLVAGGPGTGDDDNSLTSDSEDEQLLSDAEKAQKKVMLELVYGAKKPPAPTNPVDRKVESLIRESLKKAVSGSVPKSQDDLTLDTCYNTPSAAMDGMNDCEGRPRSSSLPTDLDTDETKTMDVEMAGS